MLEQNETSYEPAKYDCLLVDDEEALSLATTEYFEMYGVSTFWAPDGASCMGFFSRHDVGLVLLDINLQETSGFNLCKRIRKITDVPILFISARQSDDDRLLALSIGGDDYIQKPYSLSVLLAKVKVVLARYRNSRLAANNSSLLCVGDLALDEAELTVMKGDKKILLKPMEYKLLNYLMKNSGRIITKNELFGKVWKDAITSENTLNVHVRRLREKLEEGNPTSQYIKTVWGVGYMFNAGDENN